jgi:hypothetical protein
MPPLSTCHFWQDVYSFIVIYGKEEKTLRVWGMMLPIYTAMTHF